MPSETEIPLDVRRARQAEVVARIREIWDSTSARIEERRADVKIIPDTGPEERPVEMKQTIDRKPGWSSPPPCPECGREMALRSPGKFEKWNSFWGCSAYPDCRETLEFK